ncbi:MAG: SRPBCC family protein [Actinobacteria bacterium]|nr:SRPBCC family protein [Actinomycetota bacterium]NDA94888.1 SRPBCC family protein [Actinomycetota bacterium]NDH80515.1 SRPBCC family protein [Actinomycetota bacterium]NDH98928.1 SRPBCC family protein [Actinomycetota bacterium]NDI07225.1 SRPBCC family protein [Actinomycetota bacterium]
MADNRIALTLSLPCSAQRAWDEMTNWERQGEWMLQTSVWLTSEIETGPGTEIAAFTGPLHKFFPRFSFLGVLDTMVVTNWQPPHICDVLHTGKIIKGTGRFEVIEISDQSSQFNWSEIIWAPRIIFLILKPALYVGVWISLRRFAQTLR